MGLLLSLAKGGETTVVLIGCLVESEWRWIVLQANDVAGFEAATHIEYLVVALECLRVAHVLHPQAVPLDAFELVACSFLFLDKVLFR